MTATFRFSLADLAYLARQIREGDPGELVALMHDHLEVALPTDAPADVRELRRELQEAEEENLRLVRKLRATERELAQARRKAS